RLFHPNFAIAEPPGRAACGMMSPGSRSRACWDAAHHVPAQVNREPVVVMQPKSTPIEELLIECEWPMRAGVKSAPAARAPLALTRVCGRCETRKYGGCPAVSRARRRRRSPVEVLACAEIRLLHPVRVEARHERRLCRHVLLCDQRLPDQHDPG